MPDSKITALTSISTSTDPANDPLVIVDVSDTSMAATGTTKKVTLNQLLGASGTATLASATITGDLTVDTSTLKVDSANNRVGINNASPAQALDVAGSVYLSTNATYLYGKTSGGLATRTFGINAANDVYVGSIDQSINNIRFNSGGGDWAVLNSTGLGVGTSSHTVKLGVVDTVNTFAATFRGNVGTDFVAIGTTALGASINAFTAGFGAATNLILQPNGGNLGIGVTPAGTGGCLQLKSGITFPATQIASSDANTLDDYVEGTFTPVIQGVSTAGTGVYTVQSGRYTKIGNRVFVDIFINWTAHTGTGAMLIANLPFTIKNASNYYPSVTFGQLNNIALAANSVLTGYGTFNTKTLNLDQYPVGGGATSSVQMDTSGSIVCSVCYEV